MAFGPNGTLYTDSFSTSGDALYSIDPKTGLNTPIGTGFGAGIQIATGLFLDGTFFGFGGNVDDNSLDVYTINTSTGLATGLRNLRSLGTGNNTGIIGVAGFPASVPEPSTFILGIGAIVLTGMVTAVRTCFALSDHSTFKPAQPPPLAPRTSQGHNPASAAGKSAAPRWPERRRPRSDHLPEAGEKRRGKD